MATAQEYAQQMQDIQSQLGTYTPVSMGDITSDLMGRVDFFRPQYEEQRGTQAQAYEAFPSMMRQYAEQYGDNVQAAPDAFQMLQSGLGNIGRLMGRSDVMGDVISRAGGRIEDLARSALGQYQSAQQALNQQYQNLIPMYQQQTALEEAARQREWEAQQAELNRQAQLRAARAAASTISFPGPTSQAPANPYSSATQALNDLNRIPRIGQRANITFQMRKEAADEVLKYYPNLNPFSVYKAAGISDRLNPGERFTGIGAAAQRFAR